MSRWWLLVLAACGVALAACAPMADPSAPVVLLVSPPSGSAAGGTVVTITGTGFTGASAVSFGSDAATSFTVDSATQITATSPAGAAGEVDVTVTTPGGASVGAPGSKFTYVAPPEVSAVSPPSGPTTGGTVVTITGTDFTGATAVSFGSDAATSFTVDSVTQITATSPAGAAGEVDVTVTTPGGASVVTPGAKFTRVVEPQVSGVSIDAGTSHSCRVTVFAGVECWGANSSGQLGNGDEAVGAPAGSGFSFPSGSGFEATMPVPVVGVAAATQVSAGGEHSCAVLGSGGVKCWGDNFSGQLGDGLPVPSGSTMSFSSPVGPPRSTPVDVVGITEASEVSAGGSHTCAIVEDGAVACWGDNGAGQLGDGTFTTRSTPVLVPELTGATSLSAGVDHTCAVLGDGTITCWGSNTSGQSAPGSTTYYFTAPETVEVPGETFVDVTTGRDFTCGRTTTGSVFCWGENRVGQLGDGSPLNTVSFGGPVAVIGITDAVDVGAGEYHACARLSSGEVRCWGYNYSGQLGNGLFGGDQHSSTPVAVSAIGASTATGVAAGREHSCAMLAGGTFRCWGSNASGQLGNGAVRPVITSLTPASGPIAGGTSVTVTGAGFADVRSVWFPGLFGSLELPFTVISPTQMIVSTPAFPGGSFLWFYTPSLQQTLQIQTARGFSDYDNPTARFTYVPNPQPTITSISPAEGPVSGGNTITITGDNLTGATVYFSPPVSSSWVSVTGLVVDPTGSQAIFTAPAGVAAGDVQIAVVTTGNAPVYGSYRYVLPPSPAAQVATGADHTCALVAGGEVRCWGYNGSGQLGNGGFGSSATPVALSGLSGVTQLAAGYGHTCALVAGGEVRCWGDNASGQLGSEGSSRSSTPVAVEGLSGVTKIAAGERHTCALVSGGEVRCWGDNGSGQLGSEGSSSSSVPVAVEGLSGVSQIATGEAHTCAVVAAGEVRCWGGNSTGQLGSGSFGDASSVPVAVTGLSGVTQIAVGASFTCVVAADGEVRCWGANWAGQLGNGGFGSSATPVAVSGLSGVTRITAGSEHTCAVVAGGDVRCWGYNRFGQLGNGGFDSELSPVAVSGLSGVTQIDAGSSHSCVVVAGGEVRCWGHNHQGQLGNGVTTGRFPTPLAVSGLSGVTQVAAGIFHTCAVLAGGEARCWGAGLFGQLGNGGFDSSASPVAVSGLSGVTQVAAGFTHTCALVAGGEVRCWGGNSFGQLGSGSFGDASSVPVAVTGLSGVTQIAATDNHTCAIVASGEVRCWGDNGSGQLGNGDYNSSATPVAVSGLSGVTQISAGDNHTCAVVAGGDVRCWGENGSGQLGNGSTTGKFPTPVAVSGLSGAVQVGAGNSHTCAVLAGGEVRCWGAGSSGQLGNGGFGNIRTPVVVSGLSGVTQIAVGASYTCAVAADVQVRCWGANWAGQLGNGTTAPSSTPVAVSGLSGATQVAAATGNGHTCAVVAGGEVRCWGYNSDGQVGVAPGVPTPTVVGQPSPPSAGAVPPSVTGSALVGRQLSATRGEWLFGPSGFGFGWLSCDAAAPTDCNPVGTNSDRYTPSAGDLGRLIQVEVTATNIAGTATQRSTPVGPVVLPPAPSVSAVSPPSGPTTGGTVVTITGTDFTGATAVSFGSSPATSFTVDSDTQITATAPTGSLGEVDVQVTAPGGVSSAVAGAKFTYLPPDLVAGAATLVPAVAASGSTLWSYTALAADEVLDVSLRGADESTCPIVAISDAGGAPVGSLSGCETLPIRLGAAGRYTVSVTAGTAPVPDGAYTLVASLPVFGGVLTRDAAPVAVPVLAAGQRARFDFVGDAGERVAFRAAGAGLVVELREGDNILESAAPSVATGSLVSSLPFTALYSVDVINTNATATTAGTSAVSAGQVIAVADTLTTGATLTSPAVAAGGAVSWPVDAPGSALVVTSSEGSRCLVIRTTSPSVDGWRDRTGCGSTRIDAPSEVGTVEVSNLDGTEVTAGGLSISAVAPLAGGGLPAAGGTTSSPAAELGQAVTFTYAPVATGSQVFRISGTTSGCRTLSVGTTDAVVGSAQGCAPGEASVEVPVTAGTEYTVTVADDSDTGVSGVVTVTVDSFSDFTVGELAVPSTFSPPVIAAGQRANWTYTPTSASGFFDTIYLAAINSLPNGVCARVDTRGADGTVTAVADLCSGSQFETLVDFPEGTQLRVAPLNGAALAAGTITLITEPLPVSDTEPDSLVRPAGPIAASLSGTDPSAVDSARLSAFPCAPVLYLGARGSGQSYNPDGFNDLGMGGQVNASYRRIVDRLRDKGLGSFTVEHAGVPAPAYPANDVGAITGLLGGYSVAFVARYGPNPAAFFAGIQSGADEAVRQLRVRARDCPNQRIILGGYSQGAMVMHRALYDLLSETADRAIVSRIDGVYLLADGDRRPAVDGCVDTGSAGVSRLDGVAWSVGRGVGFGSNGPRRYGMSSSFAVFGAGLNFPIISQCNKGDIVCNPPVVRTIAFPLSTILGGVSVHTSYRTSEIFRSTDRIADNLIRKLQSNGTYPAPPRTFILNRNDNGSEGPALETTLESLGYGADRSSEVPTDLSGYKSVWVVMAYTGLTPAEQIQLADYVRRGGRLYLTGERPCCEILNQTVAPVINSLIRGGGVTVGGLGDIDGGFTINPNAAGQIALTPNPLTAFFPGGPGGMAGLGGVAGRNVLASNGSIPVAGVWDESDMVSGQGRLVVVMDIDWLRFSKRTELVANVQMFLVR